MLEIIRKNTDYVEEISILGADGTLVAYTERRRLAKTHEITLFTDTVMNVVICRIVIDRDKVTVINDSGQTIGEFFLYDFVGSNTILQAFTTLATSLPEIKAPIAALVSTLNYRLLWQRSRGTIRRPQPLKNRYTFTTHSASDQQDWRIIASMLIVMTQ